MPQYSAIHSCHTMVSYGSWIGITKAWDSPEGAFPVEYFLPRYSTRLSLQFVGGMHAFASSHLLLSSPAYSWLPCGLSPHANNGPRGKVRTGDLISLLPQLPNFSRHGNMGGISADRWTFSPFHLRWELARKNRITALFISHLGRSL